MKIIIYLILLASIFTGNMSTTAFSSSIKYGDTVDSDQSLFSHHDYNGFVIHDY